MTRLISRRGLVLISPVPPGLEEELRFWEMKQNMQDASFWDRRTGKVVEYQKRAGYKGDWVPLVTLTEDGRTACFQKGLLRRVLKFLDAQLTPYEFFEESPLAPFHIGPDVVQGLRDEQVRNLLSILAEIGSGQIGWQAGVPGRIPPTAGSGGALISATMSTGKTIIIGALILCFPNIEILVVTKKKSVIRRLRDGLRELFMGLGRQELAQQVGVYYGEEKSERRITVCSEALLDAFDTSRKRLIIHDEVHNSSGGRIAANLLAYNQAIKVGFSGTIEKHERLKFIESLFGPIVDRITDQEAEELGRVSPLVVYQLKTLTGPDVAGQEETTLEHNAVIYNDCRNRLLRDCCRVIPPEMQTIVFVRTIEHQAELLDKFLPAGFTVYHGDLPNAERQRIEKDFCAGKVLRLLATDAFSEGVDTTHVRVILEWGWSCSDQTVSQRGGRARRKTPGKRHAILITPSDDWKIETSIAGVEKENPMQARRRNRMKNYKDRGWPVIKCRAVQDIDFSTVNEKPETAPQ